MTSRRPSPLPSPRPSSRQSLFCSSPVLPPIITNEKDHRFITELNDWTRCELSKINEQDTEQCYAVYREVFSKIIEYVTAYRPLMTEIKAQYEEIINILSRGKREAFFLSGKLAEMVNAPSTLRNYQRRAEDLDTKLAVIQKDNDRLREQCNALKQSREERDNYKLSKPFSVQNKGNEKAGKDARSIPGLTLEQATNIPTLKSELEKLDRQLRELNIGSRTRYLPKEDRDNLKAELASRVADRDGLLADVERLRRVESMMRVAAESAQVYLKIQLPHQTIGDAVLLALTRAATEANQDQKEIDEASRGYSLIVDGSEDSIDSDSVDDRDADVMLDYIEQFNELMEDKRYYDAAVHAANGPRGILRTPDTMQRFADLPANWRPTDDDGTVTDPPSMSPLLAFCAALVSTVPAFRTKPDETMSRDCVQCALNENRMDLVTHWLSQNRLKLSEDMGDRILRHRSSNRSTKGHQSGVDEGVDDSCLMLAQKIYVEVGAHVSAIVTMATRGRTSSAISYAAENGCRMSELVQALRRCPRREFAEALYVSHDSRGRSFLPLGVVVTTLLQTDEYEGGIELIKTVYDEGVSSDGDDSRRTNEIKYPSLHAAVNEDEVTTEEAWNDVARLCGERGYSECASELLASVVTVFAVRNIISHALRRSDDGNAERQLEDPDDSLAPDDSVSPVSEDC